MIFSNIFALSFTRFPVSCNETFNHRGKLRFVRFSDLIPALVLIVREIRRGTGKRLMCPLFCFNKQLLYFSVLKQVTPTEKRVLPICKKD